MEQFQYLVGETRSEWFASSDATQRAVSVDAIELIRSGGEDGKCSYLAQAALTRALTTLFLKFANAHDDRKLLSLSIDFQDGFENSLQVAQAARLEWRVSGIEPHFGFNGDIVRFSGRAWIPNGSTVLSGRAQIVVYPLSRVDEGREAPGEDLIFSLGSARQTGAARYEACP